MLRRVGISAFCQILLTHFADDEQSEFSMHPFPASIVLLRQLPNPL